MKSILEQAHLVRKIYLEDGDSHNFVMALGVLIALIEWEALKEKESD